MKINFQCQGCQRFLSEVVELSEDSWWHDCPSCGTQASIWAPRWRLRYCLVSVTIKPATPAPAAETPQEIPEVVQEQPPETQESLALLFANACENHAKILGEKP